MFHVYHHTGLTFQSNCSSTRALGSSYYAPIQTDLSRYLKNHNLFYKEYYRIIFFGALFYIILKSSVSTTAHIVTWGQLVTLISAHMDYPAVWGQGIASPPWLHLLTVGPQFINCSCKCLENVISQQVGYVDAPTFHWMVSFLSEKFRSTKIRSTILEIQQTLLFHHMFFFTWLRFCRVK